MHLDVAIATKTIRAKYRRNKEKFGKRHSSLSDLNVIYTCEFKYKAATILLYFGPKR